MAAAKTKGLGKGLASLLGEFELDQKDEGNDMALAKPADQYVKIRLIEPNRHQPRKNFDEKELNELADSIRVHGVITPLIVVQREDHYMIIAGERRWRAAKQAGLHEVPVIVKDYTDREIAEVSLIENLQRSDLNPIEEALAYNQLIQEYELTQEELSETVSKSRTVITNALRLLKLPEDVRQLLEERKLSSGHAKVILALDSAEKQSEAARQIIEKNMSVRETEKLVKNFGKEKTHRSFDNEAEYRKVEEELTSKLMTKVRITRTSEKAGRITIDFNSVEEIERILEHIK